MKKVIGFDSWTGGAHHFERLIPAFKAKGLDLQLVHLASWGNELGCPNECQKGELLLRDIEFYGNNSLERILDIERPVAVILLSTDTFAHRAFIRYCDQKSIPTLNLYHGLVELTESVSESVAYTVSWSAHVKKIFSKLGKLLRHTFPSYIMALLKTKASPKDWRRFFSDIIHMAININDYYFRHAAADAKTTKCAIYTRADVEHAKRFYGFRQEDIFAVGNPDLLQFGFDEGMIGNWVQPEVSDNSIMYIETGFSSVGLFFSSEQDFAGHLIATSRSLAAQGFKMLLKLKPHGSNIQLIDQRLKGSGIKLVTNKSFLTELKACSACIAETTTLAMLPALMGMPLFFAQYGQLKSLGFGTLLTSYPRGYFLKSISDISGILEKDAQTADSGKLAQWIGLNAGPLPPEDMPERVVAVVEEMIATSNRPNLI
jgi:hypothetical protein